MFSFPPNIMLRKKVFNERIVFILSAAIYYVFFLRRRAHKKIVKNNILTYRSNSHPTPLYSVLLSIPACTIFGQTIQ